MSDPANNRFQAALTCWLRACKLRRLVRDERGATAVEFGLVAIPFFTIVLAILETALVFFAGQTLETAAADSARLIMTGQAQNQSFTAERFKQDVCARVYNLFDCSGGLSVDVKTFPSFAAISTPRPVDKDGKFTAEGFGFQPGGAGDIVVVRVFYQWPIHLSFYGFNLADMSGNKRLLSATAAFRNEPYQATGAP